MSVLSRVSDRSTISVLEIGSGAGNNLWFLARERFDASGIDGSAMNHDRRDGITAAIREVERVLKPGGTFFSEMFSDRHSERRHGEPPGDESYDHFKKGYFTDISVTFFASRADIGNLFGGCFKKLTIKTYDGGNRRVG